MGKVMIANSTWQDPSCGDKMALLNPVPKAVRHSGWHGVSDSGSQLRQGHKNTGDVHLSPSPAGASSARASAAFYPLSKYRWKGARGCRNAARSDHQRARRNMAVAGPVR
jgi:hypothetical protein